MNCCDEHAELVERVIETGLVFLEAVEAEQLAIEEEERQRKVERRKQRPWVRNWIARRSSLGGQVLIRELAEEDPMSFTNIMRMNSDRFEELLDMVKGTIQKKDTILRQALPARLKLQITLRYLATGDSLKSLAFLFRVPPQSISSFLPEVLRAIVACLSTSVKVCNSTPMSIELVQYPCAKLTKIFLIFLFQFPTSAEDWLKISGLFARKWNFPRCGGAMDGKHVIIKQPPRSGSKFFNYKQTFSIVLFALVDADYNFTYLKVGTNGRENDAAIFNDSKLAEGLAMKTLNFPEDHVILGDSIFSLKEHLMIPYSRRSKKMRHCIFNYRLSRARRIVENAFGILVWRFRVFQRPIEMKESTVDYIVLAACHLHNWLRSFSSSYITSSCVDRQDANTGDIIPGQWQQEIQPLQRSRMTKSNNYTKTAEHVRKAYAKYFCEEGAIESQWKATGISPEDYHLIALEEEPLSSDSSSESNIEE